MRKLRLEIDALTVESFATAREMALEGTVEAFGTFRGNTCGPENTCGPQTCGQLMCVIDTEAPCGGTGTGGTGGTGGATAAGFTCVGCTTQNYTNQGGDSCDYCLSFYTDSPGRCPCP